MFPYLSYGANNAMAGIVTQLAVAKALGDMKRNVSSICVIMNVLTPLSTIPVCG